MDPNTQDTPLMTAIKHKQTNLARFLVEEGKADVCVQDATHGNTALHIAVATNCSTIYENLLEIKMKILNLKFMKNRA